MILRRIATSSFSSRSFLSACWQFGQRNVFPTVEQFGEGLIAQLAGIHHILDATLKVKMAPIWLDHLHNQIVILTIDIEKELLFLKRLRVVVCRSWPASFIVVMMLIIM